MERRNFLKSVAVAGASASVISSCASAASDAGSAGLEAGQIVHCVYFWLKEGITEAEEKDFLQFFEALKKVPGIHSFNMGKPAATTARDVVDNSFQYSLIVTFKSLEDITTYEKHPDHLAAAGKFSKYWTKVAVRDTQLL
ncbi:Dabb family protein [Sphingobacterium oryzagri]|uniref:Dabb family protein n=1 Tax=Sphingobacterium oryzagri TaxID=3025669 RepID=A0ABY7WL20_9SPHI|nr:Dabb family protein [Sphingobacterium sp. KACC 22765]WDF69848.1 Dabb family protein [Sphingobacterium sp. KACC 22765]